MTLSRFNKIISWFYDRALLYDNPINRSSLNSFDSCKYTPCDILKIVRQNMCLHICRNTSRQNDIFDISY